MVSCLITSHTSYITNYVTKEVELNKVIADIQEILLEQEKNETTISDYLGVFSV